MKSPYTYLSNYVNEIAFNLSYYLQESQYIHKLFGKCNNNLSFELLSQINNLLEYGCLVAFYHGNSEILETPDERNPLLEALNSLKENNAFCAGGE